MTNKVGIDVSTKGATQSAKEVKGVRDAFENLQKKGAEGLAIGAGLAVTTKAFGILDGAISKTTDWLGEAGQKAAEEERSIAKLTTALHENVAGFSGNVDAIEATIKARTRLAFADDEQRDSLALLVTRTKDYNKALELQRLAMDLARLKGTDLATASEVVGKVYSGNVGALKRFGVAAREGATATEALEDAQAAAEGQAEAFSRTATGAFESAQIAMEDAQEAAGQKLLPVMVKVAEFARDDLAPAIEDAADVVESFALAIEELPKHPGRWWEDINDPLETLVDLLPKSERGIRNKARAAEEGAKSLGHLSRETRDAAGKTEALNRANDDVRDGFAEVRDRADKAAQAIEDYAESVTDAMDAVAKAAFGPEQLRLSLEGDKLALQEAQDELRKLERIKNPTRDQRIDINDTKKKISELEESIFETRGELMLLDGMSTADLRKQIDFLIRRGLYSAEVAARVREAWRLALQNEGYSGPPRPKQSGGGPIPFADGGFLPAGKTGLVGEEGLPEIIKARPGGGVDIIPVAGSSPTSGGSSGSAAPAIAAGDVHVHIHGVSVLSPGVAEQLAQQLGPAVSKWQQERLLIPRRV